MLWLFSREKSLQEESVEVDMNVENELKLIKESKIVAIIRGISSDDILNTAKALMEGGIRCMEVTFDHSSPEGMENTVRSITMLRQAFDGVIAIGAGTVVNTDDVRLAKSCGASFIVSPNTKEDVIRLTKELGMVSMPGALTPSEIVNAYEAGADFVKVFPADNLGLGYIKAVRGPLGYIPLIAVGGVDASNLNDFLAAGCVGVGIGGNLVNKKLIKAGEFDKLRELASTFKVN